jgi:uncharacterized membrane protein
MSDSRLPIAGWYADPDGRGGQRWWDGTAWTEHTAGAPGTSPYSPAPTPSVPAPIYAPAAPVQQQYYTPAPAALLAPAGTSASTPWYWLLAIVGNVLAIITVAVQAFSGTLTAVALGGYDSGPLAQLNPFAGYTPISLAFVGLSWVWIALSIVFAALDRRELANRGVPAPFHWAWQFFSIIGAPVYMIGRAVVAKRRTGNGLTALWVWVGLVVLSWIITIIVTVVVAGSAVSSIRLS